jgi:inorganic triphosphatase YgiF
VATETELKLAASRTALERLAAATAARAVRKSPGRRLHSVYFDSDGHDLWRRGLALRVRRDADGWTQCVKGGGSVQAGIHRRIESEARLGGEAPDIGRIENAGLAAAVKQALGEAPPRPVFGTDITRRTWTLSPEPGTQIEFSFDRGAIQTGTRREEICEIELELKEGLAWRLYETALELEREAPLRIEHRSKAERGYALARGVTLHPVKARPSELEPTLTAIAAFRAICFACIEHLQANREGLLGGEDSEYLHQMRVALRRLRSAFSVFSTLLPEPAVEPPLAEIRWLARALGPARDWDVFNASTLVPIGAQLPGHRGLQSIKRACERLRDRARSRAQRAVASRRYQRMLLGLGAWLTGESWASLLPLERARALQGPVTGYAVTALERRLRRVRKRGKKLAHLKSAELHRLRIAVKKLRYTAMFFAPLFPERGSRAMLRALEALQDSLGGINDCGTADRFIREAGASTRGELGRQAQELLTNWVAAARADHRRALRAAWKAFRAARRFWTPVSQTSRAANSNATPGAAP